MLHVAINRHSYELRGRPDLYRVLVWLRANKEFLENRARQNHWRNALLWFVRATGATPAQIASLASRWGRPPQPGSVVVESGNVEVQALSNGVGASDAGEDGRQIKLRVITGFRMAEYMFGDGYNANLASATAQQLPALTRFQAFQTLMVEQLWTPLFDRVLRTAIDAGLIPEEVEVQDADGEAVVDPITGQVKITRTCDAFEVSYSAIVQEDLLTLAKAMAIAEDREWQSKQTSQIHMGIDPRIEQKRMEIEAQELARQQARGQAPVVPDDDDDERNSKARSDDAQ
jgi:hypothetical protein